MHNILIVDDESGIRQSLKGVLEDEGYKASVADSGEACLDTLRKRSFDVVLLDVWLPGMDGLETLQKIHDIENAPEVIMISGHGTGARHQTGRLRLPRKAALHRQDAQPDQARY
jgi:two-component system, NtrC family, nitrogen regulation response regulator NtrX